MVHGSWFMVQVGVTGFRVQLTRHKYLHLFKGELGVLAMSHGSVRMITMDLQGGILGDMGTKKNVPPD